MFTFNEINEDSKLSVQEQLDKIGELNIYFKYLGYFPENDKAYKSPFARDSNPSFRFRLYDNLMWRCFSSGKSGNVIQLVSELYNETSKQATKRILNDFQTRSNVQSQPKIQVSDKFTRFTTEIQVVLRPFNAFDLDYWRRYTNANEEVLEFFNIKCCQEVWLFKGEFDLKGNKKSNLTWIYKLNNPIFRYKFSDRYKVYRPLEINKQFKWLSTTKSTDYQGFRQLPKEGDTLVITSSYKDVVAWKSLGINAIAPTSESQNIPKEHLNYFYSRFTNIYCNYDSDNAGITACEKVGLPSLFVPLEEGVKDISDLMFTKGFEYTKSLMLKQIEKL